MLCGLCMCVAYSCGKNAIVPLKKPLRKLYFQATIILLLLKKLFMQLFKLRPHSLRQHRDIIQEAA